MRGAAPLSASVPAPATVLAVDCRRLTYRFDSHVAVDAVDLAVRPGEVFGLLGPNGAGKTTTIRVITTLLPADPGHVFVFGVDVARQPMEVRRLIGYVPQMLSADAGLTGRENVSLFAELFDVPRRTRRDRVVVASDPAHPEDGPDIHPGWLDQTGPTRREPGPRGLWERRRHSAFTAISSPSPSLGTPGSG